MHDALEATLGTIAVSSVELASRGALSQNVSALR
jgi:hypothetical protein